MALVSTTTDPGTAAITLVLAVLAVVLSVASLTWQAATFVLSGSRVRAHLTHGARNAAVAVTGPPGTQTLSYLATQGYTEEVLGIEVQNIGRLAAAVTGISIALENGMKITQLRAAAGPDLPHRLEAQSSAKWFLPAAPAHAAIQASMKIGKGKDPCRVWMEAELGTGKIVKTGRTVSMSGGK